MADTKVSALTELAEAPATDDEFYIVDTSTGDSKRISAANLLDISLAKTETWAIAVSDESTDLSAAATTALATIYAPYGFELTSIEACVTTAPTGAELIGDVHLLGTTIMTTNKCDIEVSEFTTVDATTAPTLTTTTVAAGDKLEFFCDQVGSTVAGTGLKFFLTGYRT